MHSIWLILFAIAAGFTASGVVASLHRFLGVNTQTQSGKIVGTAVLALAGPSIIFQMAMNGLRAKEWKPLTCWVVVAGLTFWSLGIGLLILDIAFSF